MKEKEKLHTKPKNIGVFTTSLDREYSLLAAALHKERDEKGGRMYSDREIEVYISHLIKYGNRARFKTPLNFQRI